MADYFIYENWTRKHGAIHEGSRSYCNHGKGFQANDSGENGKWHGPMSLDEAFRRSSEMTNIEPCKICSPR